LSTFVAEASMVVPAVERHGRISVGSDRTFEFNIQKRTASVAIRIGFMCLQNI
jgi:hypothetical protein